MGGLRRHRWDGADLPPTPVNSPSQDAAKKQPMGQDSALQHAMAGWPQQGWGKSRVWGSLASVQAGISWHLHPRRRL